MKESENINCTNRNILKVQPKIIHELVKKLANPDNKFDTQLFLSIDEKSKMQGGLRTMSYFKSGGLISAFSVYEYKKKQINTTGYQFEQYKKYLEPFHCTEYNEQKDKPLITIVTVVYNGVQLLEKTILSIINQKYENLEYIIIDGGSTDGTVDIIKKYEYCIDYWVSEKDNGIYDAMNKGITCGLGKYFWFINCGDSIINDDIISQMKLTHTNVMYCHPVINVYEDINVLYKGRISNPHQGIIYSRDIFENYGLYDDYKLIGERVLWDKVSSKVKINRSDVPICYFDTSGIGTRNKGKTKIELFHYFKREKTIRSLIRLILAYVK